RDGVPDLAVANWNSDNVSVLLGSGDGSFAAARNFGAGVGPFAVAVGDFNRDGVPDLAVANYRSANVSVLLGNGDGSFQAARNYSLGLAIPTSAAVGDFNGDGVSDLAVTDIFATPFPGRVIVLLGDGQGSFQSAQNYTAGQVPSS